MEIVKELRGWAKDDIVPTDLQELCRMAATQLTVATKALGEARDVLILTSLIDKSDQSKRVLGIVEQALVKIKKERR